MSISKGRRQNLNKVFESFEENFKINFEKFNENLKFVLQ